jgi:hypothetical protein
VRFIKVKGRAGVGELARSANGYETAGRLRKDYWQDVLYNCGRMPDAHIIQDPACLGWQTVVQFEHYELLPQAVLESALHEVLARALTGRSVSSS